MSNGIGTLAEKSLHADLKEWLSQEGDQFEVTVDGFVIDVVRDEQLLEIQTANFTAMKRKLGKLLDQHPVQLYYPVAAQKWIVRQTAVGETISRRKSPKRGQPLDIFKELIRIPHLLSHPNLTLGVLLTQQEEILRDDGRGSWRRKRWSIYDRRLLTVDEAQLFHKPEEFLRLLPPSLPSEFTNKQLAKTARITTNLAQRITYTLSRCDVLAVTGKRGNANVYASQRS